MVSAGRLRRIRFALLLGALALFALLYAPQPVLPQLAGEYGLSPGAAALLVSAATLGLAVSAIPLGTLSEAIGRRRTMITTLIIAEALGLVLPWVHSFPLMVGLRLVQGAAVAGLGLLLDRDGKDQYTSDAYALGFGGPAGLGVTLDVAGEDEYQCGGKLISDYTSSDAPEGKPGDKDPCDSPRGDAFAGFPGLSKHRCDGDPPAQVEQRAKRGQ